MNISVISLIVYVSFKLKYVISYFIKRFKRDFLFYDSFSVPCIRVHVSWGDFSPDVRMFCDEFSS